MGKKRSNNPANGPEGAPGRGRTRRRRPKPKPAPAAPALEDDPFWDGAHDPYTVNEILREIICRIDARCFKNEAEEARRTGIKRQHVHNLHHERMVLTIPMLLRWANGARRNPARLLLTALSRARRLYAAV